ncbi:MAG: cell division protein SepF [Acidimicrobiales bacterium]
MYLGLVDDDEYEEYEPYEDPAPAEIRRAVRPERPEPAFETEGSMTQAVVRTLPRDDSGITIRERPSVVRPIVPVSTPRVHVVAPAGFNDAQEIGDKLRANQPVIVNLQAVDRDLSRRLIDFASGLAYGLAGQMEKVADQVFLLTPTNVEVSAEEKRRLQERGLYRA